MTSSLVTPRFVSLDTSVLGLLAADYYSQDDAKRESAREFLKQLQHRGWILLIGWHHFEELIKHKNELVAASRVNFLRSLSSVAWIATRMPPHDLGSILDIHVAEVSASLSHMNWSASQIRDNVKLLLLRFGTGLQAFGASEDHWRSLRPVLWEREVRQREIASISQAVTLDRSKEPLANVLSGKLRSTVSAQKEMAELAAALRLELSKRGDRRLPNLDQTVANFFRETMQWSGPLHDGKPNGIKRFIESLGIELSELDPNATIQQLDELAHFRELLRVTAPALSLPLEVLREKVMPDSIPSHVVQRAIRRHRATATIAEGGDLTDSYLLCLALFADLTIVDKRTRENHRRAVSKEPAIAKLLGAVRSVASYRDVLKYVE